MSKYYRCSTSERSVCFQTSCLCACPDYRGGFLLQPVQGTLREHELIEELERLRLSGHQSGHMPPSRAFTPLLDVPVDSYISSTTSTLRSRSLSPSPTHSSLLSESPHSTQRGRQPSRSPNRREDRSSPYDEVSLLTVSDRGDVAPQRGRSPVRNGHGGARREASPDSIDGRLSRQEGYTEVSVRVPSQRRGRTPLADVFDPKREKSPSTGRGSSQQLNGHSQNGHGVRRRATLQPEEYEIHTLTISKAKQSLGGCNTDTHQRLFRNLKQRNVITLNLWGSLFNMPVSQKIPAKFLLQSCFPMSVTSPVEVRA